MPRIVIATHGRLSYALRDSAELIVGPESGLECFAMEADTNLDDATRELTAFVTDGQEHERPLVLVDLFGGSPSRICTELLLRGHELDVVAGVNLPMVIAAITAPQGSPATPAALAAAAQEGVVVVNTLIEEMDAEDD